jgi:hypothetical protein
VERKGEEWRTEMRMGRAEERREESRESDDTKNASIRIKFFLMNLLSTLKLQLRHLRLSHAHLLNTDDLAPLAQPVPDSTIRVHLQCV